MLNPSPGRSRSRKSADRRDLLAESALKTLGELGYARTSLREIAANSDFTHGVIHYYFANKTELITYCVRYHEQRCITRYDELIATATSAEEFLNRFTDKIVDTLVSDCAMHRLWYDMRTQAMFDAELRPDVRIIDGWLRDMVWRVLQKYAELSGKQLRVDPPTAYAIMDGIFEAAIFRHYTADESGTDGADAVTVLREQTGALLGSLVH